MTCHRFGFRRRGRAGLARVYRARAPGLESRHRPCGGGAMPESYLPTALSFPFPVSPPPEAAERREEGVFQNASRVALSRAPTDARSVEGFRTALFRQSSSAADRGGILFGNGKQNQKLVRRR